MENTIESKIYELEIKIYFDDRHLVQLLGVVDEVLEHEVEERAGEGGEVAVGVQQVLVGPEDVLNLIVGGFHHVEQWEFLEPSKDAGKSVAIAMGGDS